jgi:hypothetical protein
MARIKTYGFRCGNGEWLLLRMVFLFEIMKIFKI